VDGAIGVVGAIVSAALSSNSLKKSRVKVSIATFIPPYQLAD